MNQKHMSKFFLDIQNLCFKIKEGFTFFQFKNFPNQKGKETQGYIFEQFYPIRLYF